MNPYPENSKIYYLYEKIRQNDFLKKHIIDEIPFFDRCTYQSIKGLTFLLFNTSRNPFLNDYLDEYLKLFPEKIDEEDMEGNTLLIKSAINNSYIPIKTIEIILNHKPNMNLVNAENKSALIYAVKNPKLVKMLLKHGSEPKNILFYASKNPKVVQILLDHGSNPNVIDKNGNIVLLSFIHQLGSIKNFFVISQSITLLLKYGVNINHKNNNGHDALYLCCNLYGPNISMDIMIKELIKYGAKIDCYDYVDEKGISNTLVDMIIERKNYHIFNTILPNRKSFICKIKNRYFDYPFIDFKIAQININSFYSIIQFL